MTSKIKDTVLPSFLKGFKSDQKSPRKRADYDLKIDQRVVTFAEDVPVRGIVRYIADEKDSHGQLIVGLELVGTPTVTLSVNYKYVQVTILEIKCREDLLRNLCGRRKEA